MARGGQSPSGWPQRWGLHTPTQVTTPHEFDKQPRPCLWLFQGVPRATASVQPSSVHANEGGGKGGQPPLHPTPPRPTHPQPPTPPPAHPPTITAAKQYTTALTKEVGGVVGELLLQHRGHALQPRPCVNVLGGQVLQAAVGLAVELQEGAWGMSVAGWGGGGRSPSLPDTLQEGV